MSQPSDIMDLQMLAVDYRLELESIEFHPLLGRRATYKRIQTPQDLRIVSNMTFYAQAEFIDELKHKMDEVFNGPYKFQNNAASMAYLNETIRSVIHNGLSRCTISVIRPDDFEGQFDAAPEYFTQ